MNGSGSDIKKAAIQKAKQVTGHASSANSSNGKKRKTGLKPIITTEGNR